MLAACAAPSITENPLDTPGDGPPVVSVCYAWLGGRGAEVEALIREACAEAGIPDAVLEYWKRTVILNECPLLKKSRAAYFCLPAAAAGTDLTGDGTGPDPGEISDDEPN